MLLTRTLDVHILTASSMAIRPTRYGELWSREESILAFYLYCQIPFQKTKANNAGVQELARVLNRSPASVARKLGNFGSFDPELRKQGISGLPNAGAIAEQVWNEFHDDWSRLVTEAEAIRRQFELSVNGPDSADQFDPPTGPSERLATRKERVHQSFFRAAVLTSYLDTCCVTGIAVSECLVASHIVPWSKNEKSRTDPTNGLCLSATFDRLFDSGFIAVDENYCIVISRWIRDSEIVADREHIARFHGKPMNRPHRFLPSQTHLEWHRCNIFKSD